MHSVHSKKPAIVMTRFPYDSEWGGEESHTLVLAKYFRDKGHEVIFLGNCPTLIPNFQEEGFQVCEVEGGRMIVTPLQLLKSFFLAHRWKSSMVRAFHRLQNEYDIKALYCLSLNEKLFLTSEALKSNIPVTWVEHQEIRNWLLKSPWRSTYKKFAAKVRIVPISRKNKHTLQNALSIPSKNIFEIIHGVSLEEIVKIRRETKRGLIVAANRLIPKKGMMDFLAAMKILFEEGLILDVVVIGEGEERSQIEGELTSLHLQFEREVELSSPLKKEQWYEILSKADVYVSCARDTNETFSLNTAEAMAAGCKVVATWCSGIADYLQDGEDAFLAEPKNPKHLAQQIKMALGSSEKMREKAKKKARDQFDLKRMLAEYERVILRKN